MVARANRDRWWAAVDSNHLPPRYQHGALPVELAARDRLAGAEGFEPSTLGFGDRCSDQAELRPSDRGHSLPRRCRGQLEAERPNCSMTVGAGSYQHQASVALKLVPSRQHLPHTYTAHPIGEM